MTRIMNMKPSLGKFFVMMTQIKLLPVDKIMKRITLIAFVALLASACGGNNGPQITVYKSPTCGCCKQWIAHLEDKGFNVKAVNVADVTPYKEANGVTPELRSCHTALVDGYVVEGHVPAQDIQRLITEKPQLQGLAVPGMPAGSPGMEQPGPKNPYTVVGFDNDGKRIAYSEHNP